MFLMGVAWLAVGAVYAATFALGIVLQHVLDGRGPGSARSVQFLYLWIPLGSAMVVAVVFGLTS
jgi:hypothetical protein